MTHLPITGHLKIRQLADGILNSIDVNGGYGVPIGFVSEPYNTDLHKALRGLAQANKIRRIAAPRGTHAEVLEQLGSEIWGKG